jgi:hypothetical protein
VLSHVSRQGIGHLLGELWDLEKTASVANQVAADGELIRELGVTTIVPIWTIGIDRYVYPPFQSEIK